MKCSKAAIHRKPHRIPEIKFEDQRLTSFAGLVVYQTLLSCSSKSGTFWSRNSVAIGTPRSRSHPNTSASRQATAREPIGWLSGNSPRLTMA
jgi:hypothetical protein